MSTDRELDVRLAGAAGIRDADLPPLPDDFLAGLRTGADEPASVLAARQLVADARQNRLRRRPSRKLLLRAGGAVVAIAATFAVAVLVTPAEVPAVREATPTPTPTEAPVDGITLVAAERATFPLSLDPVPEGLTATFSRWGGVAYYPGQPLVYSADYSSADGDRVLVRLFQEDPRAWPDADDWSIGDPATGSVTVDGAAAEVRDDGGSVNLLWEWSDGRWLQVVGEGAYAGTDAAVAVAESIVDRPQPVGLQFGLAPVGWSIGGYEESRSLDLVSDTQPQQLLRLSLIGREGGLTIDSALIGTELAAPVVPVTVKGLEGRLALVDGYDAPDYWNLVGQFADGPMFLLVAPQDLTEEQVVAIADQVTYSP